MIAAVVAIAGGATYANVYLNEVKEVAGAADADMSYKIAEVKIGGVAGFPMNFTNMVPETVYDKTADIRYSGTTAGDLYFRATFIDGYANLKNFLKVRIAEVNDEGSVSRWVISDWADAETLYTWIKLDSNLAPNDLAHYKIYVKVFGSDGINAFQGQTAVNGVQIQAIQAGAVPQ